MIRQTKRTRKIGKLHPLCLALVEKGFTYREAHKLVNVVFDCMRNALQRGEQVQLPFGTLKVAKTNKPRQRRWTFGHPHETYRKRTRVVLEQPREQGN